MLQEGNLLACSLPTLQVLLYATRVTAHKNVLYMLRPPDSQLLRSRSGTFGAAPPPSPKVNDRNRSTQSG